ncbi:hypothetical protein IFM89_026633 [Coptis chinensis]|uniref:Uncharacterized protein n=1 Tax=Coptis chinensis TaxID=261450 RepID=A0A835LJI4_9MAGN|nr:hypothetical protein IFM89_026633 [Coptis chinensis]
MQLGRCHGTLSVYYAKVSKLKIDLKQAQCNDIDNRYFNQADSAQGEIQLRWQTKTRTDTTMHLIMLMRTGDAELEMCGRCSAGQKFNLFCYGPPLSALDRTVASYVSNFCKSLYAWELPSEISISGQQCKCGGCVLGQLDDPDAPNLPSFYLKTSCLSESDNLSKKRKRGDVLVGPVLPFPYVLTLREVGKNLRKDNEFSAEAEVALQCNVVMKVVSEKEELKPLLVHKPCILPEKNITRVEPGKTCL